MSTATQNINKVYDQAMFDQATVDNLGGDHFHNFGFWRDGVEDYAQAHQDMMAELTSAMGLTGPVLDVACGMGASTRYLSERHDPAQITGINISEKQLQQCRSVAPGCRFANMDATRLEFPDASFEDLLCIEAAFHFNTREKFFFEAYRVLRSGGHLTLADVLVSVPANRRQRFPEFFSRFPEGNDQTRTIDDYASLLQKAGFKNITIGDVSRECTDRYVARSLEVQSRRFAHGEISQEEYTGQIQRFSTILRTCRPYIFVSAEK